MLVLVRVRVTVAVDVLVGVDVVVGVGGAFAAVTESTIVPKSEL